MVLFNRGCFLLWLSVRMAGMAKWETGFWIILAITFGALAIIAKVHSFRLKNKLEKHKGRGAAISNKDPNLPFISVEWELYEAMKQIFLIEFFGFILAGIAAIGTIIF